MSRRPRPAAGAANALGFDDLLAYKGHIVNVPRGAPVDNNYGGSWMHWHHNQSFREEMKALISDEIKELIHTGKGGGGFDDATINELRYKIDQLEKYTENRRLMIMKAMERKISEITQSNRQERALKFQQERRSVDSKLEELKTLVEEDLTKLVEANAELAKKFINARIEEMNKKLNEFIKELKSGQLTEEKVKGVITDELGKLWELQRNDGLHEQARTFVEAAKSKFDSYPSNSESESEDTDRPSESESGDTFILKTDGATPELGIAEFKNGLRNAEGEIRKAGMVPFDELPVRLSTQDPTKTFVVHQPEIPDSVPRVPSSTLARTRGENEKITV